MGSKSYKITYVKTERQQYSDWIQNWTCKGRLSHSNYNLEFILILTLTKFNQSQSFSDSNHEFELRNWSKLYVLAFYESSITYDA